MNVFIVIYDFFNKKIFDVDSLQERRNARNAYDLYKIKQEIVYLEFINQCNEALITRQDKNNIFYFKLIAIRDYVKELYFILHDDAEKLEEIRKERRLTKYNTNLNEASMSNEKNQWRSELKKIVNNIKYHIEEKRNSPFHVNYRKKLEEFISDVENALNDNATLYNEFDNQLIELISKGLREIEIGNRFYGANLFKIKSLMKKNELHPCTISMKEISRNHKNMVIKYEEEVEHLTNQKEILEHENDVFRQALDNQTNGKLTILENKYNNKIIDLKLEFDEKINSVLMLVQQKELEIKKYSIITPEEKQEIINEYLDKKIKAQELKHNVNIKPSNLSLFNNNSKNEIIELELKQINEYNN